MVRKKKGCALKNSKQSLSEEEKPLPKISAFFKAAAKPIDKVNIEEKDHEQYDSRLFFINELKKTLRRDPEEDNTEKENGVNEENSAIEDENCVTEHVNSITEHESSATENESFFTEKENANKKSESKKKADDGIHDFVCTGCVRKSDELILAELKYKDLHKRYVKLTVFCTELGLKYEDLLKTGIRMELPDVDVDEETDSEDLFTAAEKKVLDNVPLLKKNDSTFILHCLKFAYKNDLKVMHSKSVKGKPPSKKFDNGKATTIQGKNPLSPDKVARIRQLYVERLSKCKISSVEHGQRMNNTKLNQLLNSSIKNISKITPQ